MKERIFITGVTGQDGSILARQYLTETNAYVYGLVRRSSAPNYWRINDLLKGYKERFELIEGDITDMSSLIKAFRFIKPDKVFNCAAQSHVGTSFEEPIHSANVTGIGVVNILEAVRNTGLEKSTRILTCSSSEMYGDVLEIPQTEETPFRPQSPYACAKVYAHHMCRVYREAYKMFVSCSICFNHEGPYRGENFVTRKITSSIADILKGEKEYIYLGNLAAKRDWGDADDFCRGMRKILNVREPDDYVLATGETRTVQEFLDIACKFVGLDSKKIYQIDERFFRPLEVNQLIGDASKARRKLGWIPMISFEGMVKRMLVFDLELKGLDPDKYMVE